MSVDQRIREGLVMLDQKIPPPDTATALDVVEHGARTRSRNRGLLAAAGAAAAAAVALGATQLGGDSSEVPAPVDEPTSGPSQVTDAAALAGVWRTPERVSARDMAESLRGQPEYRKYLRGFASIPGLGGQGSRLTLTFRYGEVILSVGKPSEDNFVDWQTYEVDGPVVYFRPRIGTGGRSIYTAVVDGDELRLRFVETNADPIDVGLEEGQMQPGLFTASTYQRVR